MNTKNIYVKDINAGDRVSDIFLVTEKNMAISQKGNPYLNLKLRDITGAIDGRVWDRAAEMNNIFQTGDIIHIQSNAVSFRDVIQLSISKISVINDPAVSPADYLPSTKSDISEMFESLMSIIGTIGNPHLKALLELIFEDEEIADSFQKAPAAKGFHHAYIGGLLEHTLSVTQLLDLVADHYQQANRDLIITGGILHDIGKIYELSFKGSMNYTDEGRLIGHIVIAVELVDKKTASIEGFPSQLALELRHILLSHHGTLEYGSPKRPKTIEALIVNFIDDLDAKMNAFSGFINVSVNESNWTPYHRLLERFLYKGQKPESEGTEDGE
ncbi:MAG: HD domain-containing protein [Thermodesulfobacteriota bacterium]|nr:HD domain-containing protein [Thermodesulfobacteriota bacterium]